MTEHPAPLAIVRTTDDLREVFRRRVAQLNISLETLDAIAGLPTTVFVEGSRDAADQSVLASLASMACWARSASCSSS